MLIKVSHRRNPCIPYRCPKEVMHCKGSKKCLASQIMHESCVAQEVVIILGT